jgi:hypothetical protein
MDEDTLDSGAATSEETQDTAADTADDGSSTEDGSQETGDQGEQLLAGKYKTQEDLEKGYIELASKLGNHATLEEKARAFDELSLASIRQSAPAPKTAQDFVSADGSVDWVGYNDYMVKNQSALASRAAREQIDIERAERDFGYLTSDKEAADTVMALYSSGRVRSIYEGAQRLDRLRQGEVATARKEGAQEKEREIASKVKGQTERASAKASEGGLTVESFGKLSLEEKRKIVQGFAS